MKLPPDKLFQKVRELCLSYPDSNEVASWGHPNFRVGKKAFVTFERWEGRPSIAFRVQDPSAANALCKNAEFFATPYGRGKWVSLWIDRDPPDWRLIKEWIVKSFQAVQQAQATRSPDSRK